jgi:bifunctional non-homologous end joining protein LigD
VRSAVIDGEALVLRDDGHSDFHAMKGRGARDAMLVAFDLLQIDDEDIRRESIETRRARLASILASPPDGVQFSQAIDGDGDVIFRNACVMGLEGIVSKRLGSSYRSGRCAHWLKIKNPAFGRG